MGRVTNAIRFSQELISSVPSIVVGLFGLALFVNATHWGFTALGGALALTVFNLPLMSRLAEQAIRAVPDDERQASLALGTTKWADDRPRRAADRDPGHGDGRDPDRRPDLRRGRGPALHGRPRDADPLRLRQLQPDRPALAMEPVPPGDDAVRLHLEDQLRGPRRVRPRDRGHERPRSSCCSCSSSTSAPAVSAGRSSTGSPVPEQTTVGSPRPGGTDGHDHSHAYPPHGRPLGQGGQAAKPTCSMRRHPPRAEPVTETDKLAMTGVDIYYGSQGPCATSNLRVPANAITAFIGPSGCGKSTVLRCFNRMNDLIPSARVDGQGHPRRRGHLCARRPAGRGPTPGRPRVPAAQPVPDVDLRERRLRPAPAWGSRTGPPSTRPSSARCAGRRSGTR